MKLIDEISKSFSKAAATYEQTALVQNEIGDRLLERLQYIRLKPQWILDLGCGSGYCSQKLRQFYPNARIISLDLTPAMLQQVKKKQHWWRKWPLICADMHQLPFVDGLFDLVFTNQVLHWSQDMPSVLNELARVMNVNACLMFSTLGPDTFKEIRETYATIDAYAHVNAFMDMHDIGDHMLRAHLLDPVVDMEYLTVRYSTLEKMLSSLKSQGVKNVHPDRNKGLNSRSRLEQFKHYYQQHFLHNQKYPLTYEVIYAHAWRSPQRSNAQGSETRIPITAIKRPHA